MNYSGPELTQNLAGYWLHVIWLDTDLEDPTLPPFFFVYLLFCCDFADLKQKARYSKTRGGG